MTWVKKLLKEEPHPCELPGNRMLFSDRVAEGSIWECDECKQQWVLNRTFPDRRWEKLVPE